jgi:4-diphosphocytidyl-2-C-methyl-D-erythritol kinase
LISFPNAKVNLGLNIVAKRTDGYHNIETCFFPVNWCDVLEIVPSDTIRFTSSGIEIPGNPDQNLCLKAYHLLKKDFNLPPVHIHLHKIIPIGAGLGGGSSDAAFTLKNLNTQFELSLTDDQLIEYARQLGSDCAFFIKNNPVLAKEKGDVFEEIELDLYDKKIILIYPKIHVSTADAYGGVQPGKPEKNVGEILSQPLVNWKDLLKNDFEDTIFPKYPEIRKVKESLYESGAVYASMSGSGSAVFGIFENDIDDKIFKETYMVWKGELK